MEKTQTIKRLISFDPVTDGLLTTLMDYKGINRSRLLAWLVHVAYIQTEEMKTKQEV